MRPGEYQIDAAAIPSASLPAKPFMLPLHSQMLAPLEALKRCAALDGGTLTPRIEIMSIPCAARRDFTAELTIHVSA